MSIKTFTLATGIALTLFASGNAAFADPYIQVENQAQYATSAQESLLPVSAARGRPRAAQAAAAECFQHPRPLLCE